MARLPIPGSDQGQWGEILNDYLSVAHNNDGSLKNVTIPAGSITPTMLSQSYVPTSLVASPDGVASLDGSGKVPSAQLPAMQTIDDATSSTKGVVQLAGDLGGTAASPTVPGLASKVSTGLTITAGTGLTGGGDLTANRTFAVSFGTSSTTAAAGDDSRITGAEQTANKGAVNGYASLDSGGKVPSSQIPAVADATTGSKGIIQLAGDLAGTATTPTVPGLANKAATSTTISAGTGLTGGGDLSANRTLAVSYGTAAGTAAQGNDSRITGAEQAANKGVVNGYASLDGTGKVPTSQMAIGSRIQPFSSSGPLLVEVGGHRLYNDTSAAWTILSVRASVGTPPVGSALIVDVNVSGATIFTTQGNRPTIAAAGNTSGKITNMNITTVASGAYLTIDVDQVGSTTPGNDLAVQVEVI
jgi:hypothetical protein